LLRNRYFSQKKEKKEKKGEFFKIDFSKSAANLVNLMKFSPQNCPMPK